MAEKRKRNFSDIELGILRAECLANQSILFGSFGANLTRVDRKNAWEDVTRKVGTTYIWQHNHLKFSYLT